MASRKSRDTKRNLAKQAQGDEEKRPQKKGATLISWIMLAMILVGLGGFGITNFGGGVTNVASVGGTDISVNDYGRALKQELQALSSQTGQNVTMQQARSMGIDRQVLQRLILTAAMDDEDARLGVSVGNAKLRANITTMKAFQGPDGKFSRDAYRFVLKQNGLSEGEFENKIRDEMARGILQDAVVNGFGVPQSYVDTIIAYAGARRGFDILKLTADDLTSPIPTATDAQLQAFYKAHPKNYTSLPAKRITYAELLPDQVAKTIKISDAELKKYYDAHKADYVKPERRLVERLVYPDEATAKAAKAKLDAGTTFEALVKARGLDLTNVDMGDVTADDLSKPAAAAVFAAKKGAVVGPVQSALGPALFRVNNVLPAQTTSFDEAKSDIQDELAATQARSKISGQIEKFNDMLAGGATLEDMAKETDMSLGTIDFTAKSKDGIAGYENFRTAAQKVTTDDYPEIIQLDDGGIVALRLDKNVAPAVEPFAKVKDQVAEDWTTDQTDKALQAKADAIVKEAAANGGDLSKAGPLVSQDPIERTGYIDGAPKGLMSGVFDMKKGEVKAFAGKEEIWIVKLTQILPPDETDPDVKKARAQLADRGQQGIANDAFLLFAQSIQARQGIQVNQSALNAVNSQFH